MISFYEGFYDEEICAGYPADKYDEYTEKNITLGIERYLLFILVLRVKYLYGLRWKGFL